MKISTWLQTIDMRKGFLLYGEGSFVFSIMFKESENGSRVSQNGHIYLLRLDTLKTGGTDYDIEHGETLRIERRGRSL